jgi:hypothetical protein
MSEAGETKHQPSSSSKEPNSWVDLVRSIDHDRKHLPWDPSTTSPVERVSLYQVSYFSIPSCLLALKITNTEFLWYFMLFSFHFFLFLYSTNLNFFSPLFSLFLPI